MAHKLDSKKKKNCSYCGAICWETETKCWQCGRSLSPPPQQDESKKENTYITFDSDLIDAQEVKDTTEFVQPSESAPVKRDSSQSIEPTEQVMRLTFCKYCGYQNQEGDVECRKCHKELEWVSAKTQMIVEPVKRFWGFDVLGAIWVILGFAAVYSRIFLIHTSPGQPAEPSDYLWTGFIVCIPGALIFVRHYFSRFLFWAMSLISLFVWFVIFAVWITGHLFVSLNLQVGLIWLAIFSILTLFSFYVVRMNDEFNPLL